MKAIPRSSLLACVEILAMLIPAVAAADCRPVAEIDLHFPTTATRLHQLDRAFASEAIRDGSIVRLNITADLIKPYLQDSSHEGQYWDWYFDGLYGVDFFYVQSLCKDGDRNDYPCFDADIYMLYCKPGLDIKSQPIGQNEARPMPDEECISHLIIKPPSGMQALSENPEVPLNHTGLYEMEMVEPKTGRMFYRAWPIAGCG